MFAALARVTAKFRLFIILFWLVLSAVMIIFAPSLSKVGVTDDTQFLPRNTESIQAETLIKSKFTGAIDSSVGSALVVVHNPVGLNEDDNRIARELCSWLSSPQSPSSVKAVMSVFDNQALRSTLVSSDGTTMLIKLDLSVASSSVGGRETIKTIRSHIDDLAASSWMLVTGPAGIYSDAIISIQQTINYATWVTLILVIVLLLLIYRSPVAMLVPLITIGISYLVARGAAGFVAAAGTNVSNLVDAYLVVTLFGIGTDYCLFMVSRFKEELRHNETGDAGQLAMKRIGPVILASATTVIVALLCLGISRFGMNRTSGFILAIGVAITLLAGLTLAPALISLFGKKLLWPGRLTGKHWDTSSDWRRISEGLTRRPEAFIIPLIVVLSLSYLALPKMNFSANLLSQMSETMGSVEGYNIMKEHFHTGKISPMYVVIENPAADLTSIEYLETLKGLETDLRNVNGVTEVRSFSTPAPALLELSNQIHLFGQNLNPASLTQMQIFQSVGQSLNDIAVGYPGVTQSTNFQSVISALKRLSGLTGQLQGGSINNLPAVLTQIQPLITGIADGLAALASEFNLQVDSPFSVWLQSMYFAEDGHYARQEVVLDGDPYSPESIEAVDRVRSSIDRSLAGASFTGMRYYVGGTSAAQADILAINNSDFFQVLILAVIGIVLVTALLLRSLIAPLYMIITVLFNFGSTLGIATWLFLDILKQNSLIYMLPIFVFVILVAVGSDYNIFLVSRIREEAHRRPLKDAIIEAVTNTGGVITSCGIILAGTFATLTTASLQMVFQVGTAIGLGVLIDTFLVRALLIPSLAVLIGRWNWWPSKLSRK
jgi:RND superfamily putative drug exporter